MEELLIEFSNKLKEEDRNACISIAVSSLATGRIGVMDLYTGVLAPSLNTIGCDGDNKLCIWKEHVRTSIIRSVIENTYPFVMKTKETSGRKEIAHVAVVCPDGEYHEIGARMAADFFDMNGFTVTFVGASTPVSEFLHVINQLKPDYIALSVTNIYNIVAAKKTVEAIKSKLDYNVGIIAGGRAFTADKELYKEIGADLYLQTYDDIVRFALEVTK